MTFSIGEKVVTDDELKSAKNFLIKRTHENS